MANYTNLKSTINAQIRANGTGAITGPVLNGVLRDMVSALGEAGYLYKGVATPATSPGTPDSNVFYIASIAGTYTNFGGAVVADGEVAILKYNGTWTKEVTGAATAAQVTQLSQDVADNTDNINALQEEINDIQPIVIEGNVTNAPDEEDITTDENDLLKFKDRTQAVNQMGYVILRKTAPFATQATASNTIYEIRYPFHDEQITIPENCVLLFRGGTLDTCEITFNKTMISGDARFIDCEFSGTILNDSVMLSWFTEGMANTTDYSTDHSPYLISAMRLASLKNQGWLDLERIPICIKQTVVVTDAFGNIGMRNGLIYFVSTADKQALFDYQQSAAYKGNYSPIVDCVFNDVGDNYNTCCIKKTNWSDTLFTYWRDIKVYGFTGYFFVTNSYVQECTFENISVAGCGFFTTNSDDLYTGGYGTGNILNFLNCNCNNGSSTSKTSIKAIYDMSGVIEATIHNAVCQGRIGGSNIYPVYITYKGVDVRRSNIVLDGCWVEYVDGHVLPKVKIEGASAMVTIKRNSIPGIEVVSSNATIILEQEGGKPSNEFFDNLDIDSISNVTLIVNSGFFGALLSPTQYEKFKRLVDDGILRLFQNNTPPFGANLATQTGVGITLRPINSADLLREYITSKITGISVPQRAKTYNKLGTENGSPILIFENTESQQYYDFIFANHFEKILGGGYATYQSRSIWVEIIYRATILVDVTSENISQVYCQGRGFLNAGGGSYANFINPTVGMMAGETTGWIKKAFCYSWKEYGFVTAGSNLQMRNTRFEIASFKIGRRNVDISEDPFIDGNGALQRIDKSPKAYYMPIAAGNDNLATMAQIINDCPVTVETPKNVYKYANGALHALYTPTSGTTANRPALTSVEAGFVYFDKTLNKAIISNGSAWVNMDGSALS